MFRKRSVKGDPQAEFQCTVRFLDDSEPVHLTFKKETPGQILFDQVCSKLNLVEKDYFGLRYVDTTKEKQRHWLDPLKSVYKQLKGVNPCVLCFRVKFYPSDPMKLHEEITRYYLFLQLRRDLHHGRLLCSPADANLLAAYIIQSELGDYDEQDHPPGYVTEFKMLPKQNAKMEEEIAKLHKTLSGQVPAEAEGNFLKKASTLDTYGVDPHVVWDNKGTQLYLGVTHQGVMTFKGSRRTQLYKWGQIKKVPTFDGKMFVIHVDVSEEEETTNNKKGPHAKKKLQPIGYKCENVPACKYLWRCAVEQQLFFTLTDSSHPPKVRSGNHWFSRGSKFRFSGRCQNEAINASDDIKRTEPEFNRSSSLPNYGRKTDSKSSLKNKSMTLDTSIKEDKKKTKNYKESPVDVPGGKNDVIAVAEMSPTGPVVKAPMAKPEETSIEEMVAPQFTMVKESAPKQNGGIPSVVVMEADAELPPYEPNQTVIEEVQGQPDVQGRPEETSIDRDDEEGEGEDTKPRASLEDQIKDLEEQIERKLSFTETNHVENKAESQPVTETITPDMVNHVEETPKPQNDTKTDTKPVPEPTKSKGATCCKIFIMTFFFIILTLAVTALVVMNSSSSHPAVVKVQEHLQFIHPVRDYVNDKVQLLLNKM